MCRARSFAVWSIVCSLFGCRDALDPVNSRPASLRPSMASATQLAESRFLVVFDRNGAPSDLGGRVSALGGVVDTHLENIGLAVVTGLTPAGAQELQSVPGIIAVEPDLILSAAADPEDLAIDPGESDATAVAVQSAAAAPTDASFYARQWNLRAIHADAAWAWVCLAIPTSGWQSLTPVLITSTTISPDMWI